MACLFSSYLFYSIGHELGRKAGKKIGFEEGWNSCVEAVEEGAISREEEM